MRLSKYKSWIVPVLGALALMAIALGSVGCDALAGVVSPLTGEKPASAAAIVAEATKQERAAQAERDASAEANAARARAAEIDAQKRALEIMAQAQDAGLGADRALAELRLSTQARLDQIQLDDAASAKRYQDTIDKIGEDVAAASQAIEARRAQTKGLLDFITNNPIVAPALASVGVTPGQVSGQSDSLLYGGAGALLLWSQSRGKKKADASYDEGRERAKQEAEEKAKAEAKAWDEAKAEARAEAAAVAQQQFMAQQQQFMAQLLAARVPGVAAPTPDTSRGPAVATTTPTT